MCLPLAGLGQNTPAAAASSAASPAPSPLLIADYPAPDVPARDLGGERYFADAMLVGDSLARGLFLNRALEDVRIIAKIGQSAAVLMKGRSYKADGRFMSMVELINFYQPKKLYLWLGSNGVDRGKMEVIVEDYRQMLESLRRQCPQLLIYCMSVAPVVEARARVKYPNMTNAKIQVYNEHMRALAQASQCYFLPLAEALADDTGALRADFAAPDGIHLNGEGYRALAEYLRTHTIPLEDRPYVVQDEPTPAPRP